nr:MAG TPA: hypothetical protein [Crassvirales sp.]
MDNMFDVLYNNITSNQAPGLNAYEKSVFLTKAQDEIIKNYFNPKSKGNNTQEGFDGSAKRQVDFSTLIQTWSKESDFDESYFDPRDNTQSVSLPVNVMFIINEMVTVIRNTKPVLLQVVPIKFDEYSRLMCKPYKRPLKYQAWRLTNNDTANKADIIIGPSDTLSKYTIRYVKRPTPIVVADLDGLTIDGDDTGKKKDCILDPILHEEIVQRAVELAKVAWTNTGQDNLQAVMQAGQRSE